MWSCAARPLTSLLCDVPLRRPPGDNTVELLESLGADVVVTPDVLGNPEDYARAVAGLPRPRLGLNCVGGSIATSVSD